MNSSIDSSNQGQGQGQLEKRVSQLTEENVQLHDEIDGLKDKLNQGTQTVNQLASRFSPVDQSDLRKRALII